MGRGRVLRRWFRVHYLDQIKIRSNQINNNENSLPALGNRYLSLSIVCVCEYGIWVCKNIYIYIYTEWFRAWCNLM